MTKCAHHIEQWWESVHSTVMHRTDSIRTEATQTILPCLAVDICLYSENGRTLNALMVSWTLRSFGRSFREYVPHGEALSLVLWCVVPTHMCLLIRLELEGLDPPETTRHIPLMVSVGVIDDPRGR